MLWWVCSKIVAYMRLHIWKRTVVFYLDHGRQSLPIFSISVNVWYFKTDTVYKCSWRWLTCSRKTTYFGYKSLYYAKCMGAQVHSAHIAQRCCSTVRNMCWSVNLWENSTRKTKGNMLAQLHDQKKKRKWLTIVRSAEFYSNVDAFERESIDGGFLEVNWRHCWRKPSKHNCCVFGQSFWGIICLHGQCEEAPRRLLHLLLSPTFWVEVLRKYLKSTSK